MKTCTKCKVEKPLDRFHKDKNTKDGHRPQCKDCIRESSRKYAAKTKDQRKEYARAYYVKNKAQINERNRKNKLLARYGVSPEQFQQMKIRQCNTCAVCHEWLGDDAAVDHCHETGKVRGLLHTKCNAAIGILKDDPLVLQNAIYYLRGTHAST